MKKLIKNGTIVTATIRIKQNIVLKMGKSRQIGANLSAMVQK